MHQRLLVLLPQLRILETPNIGLSQTVSTSEAAAAQLALVSSTTSLPASLAPYDPAASKAVPYPKVATTKESYSELVPGNNADSTSFLVSNLQPTNVDAPFLAPILPTITAPLSASFSPQQANSPPSSSSLNEAPQLSITQSAAFQASTTSLFPIIKPTALMPLEASISMSISNPSYAPQQQETSNAVTSIGSSIVLQATAHAIPAPSVSQSAAELFAASPSSIFQPSSIFPTIAPATINTAVVLGQSSSIFPTVAPATINTAVVLGQSTSKGPSGIIQVGGSTLVPGSPAITASGIIISLNSATQLVVGSETISHFNAATATAPPSTASVTTLLSQTISKGASGAIQFGSATLIPGAQAITASGTLISLNSATQLVVGSSTVSEINLAMPTTLSAPTITISRVVVSLNSASQLVVGSSTISDLKVGLYASATTGKSAIVVLDQTISIGPSGNLQIGSATLIPGSAAITLSTTKALVPTIKTSQSGLFLPSVSSGSFATSYMTSSKAPSTKPGTPAIPSSTSWAIPSTSSTLATSTTLNSTTSSTSTSSRISSSSTSTTSGLSGAILAGLGYGFASSTSSAAPQSTSRVPSGASQNSLPIFAAVGGCLSTIVSLMVGFGVFVSF
ncbi:MAG: hypothetical protein M1829_005035 [Trizodia sp. TS-e1964]|nr:MAG: hypothetical protein M1829_005035 [Trizodia sp. TS-e1964]